MPLLTNDETKIAPLGRRHGLLSAILFGTLLGWAALPSAWAQMDSREAIGLQNQIYQLRQELQQLRDQAGRGGYAPPARSSGYSGGGDMAAQLLTRVDALEEQVRQLRGRIDELQNMQQRQSADLAKRIDDLAFQMNPQGAQPSRPTNPPPGAAPSPYAPQPSPYAPQPSPYAPQTATPLAPAASTPPNPAPTQPTPSVVQPSTAPRTPERALQEGNAALARRDYIAAEQAAREVLANRTSPRAYDAQFLLARSLIGLKQYPQAAIAYDDTYNRSRKGIYAQDALLGLANALGALNERKAACDTLQRLQTEFPQLRTDLREEAAASRQRAGCR